VITRNLTKTEKLKYISKNYFVKAEAKIMTIKSISFLKLSLKSIVANLWRSIVMT